MSNSLRSSKPAFWTIPLEKSYALSLIYAFPRKHFLETALTLPLLVRGFHTVWAVSSTPRPDTVYWSESELRQHRHLSMRSVELHQIKRIPALIELHQIQRMPAQSFHSLLGDQHRVPPAHGEPRVGIHENHVQQKYVADVHR